jgi:hypothetical protein
VLGAGIAAWLYRESSEVAVMAVAFGVFGFVAGLVVWIIDVLGRRKSASGDRFSERGSSRPGGRRRTRR